MSTKISTVSRFAVSFFVIALILGTVQFFYRFPAQAQASAEKENSFLPLGASYAVVHDMPIPSHIYSPDRAIYDPVYGRLYVIFTFEDLIVFDVNTGETTVLENMLDVYSQIAISPDGNYLYSRSGYDPRIDVYETTNFSLINSYAAPTVGDINVHFVASTDNRLYFGMHDTIEVLNASTGAVIQSYDLGNYSSKYIIDISPDEKFLYLVSGSYTDLMYKFDISSGSVTELKKVNLGKYVFDMDISGNGEFITLIVSGGELVVYDAQTLTPIHSIPKQASLNLVDASADVDDNQFFALFGGYGSVPTVIAWDASSGDMLRKYVDSQPWKYSYEVIPIGDGRIAIVLDDAVKVLTPTSHGVALTVIMNDYCTTSIVDDFSDPTSGWPVGTSGTITYQYLNGEYNIFHAHKNRWTAVSRGLVWNNSKQIEVEGRLATNSNGLFGLLYGLNQDWTDFYVFEVFPNNKAYAIMHFTSENGWEVIANGTSSAIRTGTATNRLRITQNQPDSDAYFYINNGKVYTVQSSLPAGRVGITGGAFEYNVDLRYDNFLFADKNCPVTNQLNTFNGKSLDTFVIQDRPALDSLLLNTEDR